MKSDCIAAAAFSLFLLLFPGCGELSRPSQTLSTFECTCSEGAFSHDVYFKYIGSPDLSNVDVTIKIDAEKGPLPEEKRIWATWKAGESKTVNVSASKGPMQRFALSGNAVLNGEYVRLSGQWRRND